MSTEEFVLSPRAFRALLCGKIAMIVEKIRLKHDLDSLDALRLFYRSPLYQKLEIEETKYWWESPVHLFMEFEQNFPPK
ncbi:MAG: hypothetical protein Q4G69_06420 [Planctomycetia bacterium]|nr:hypothetical protein [Planctomycetia bacterium]